jgi:hypothetical protein
MALVKVSIEPKSYAEFQATLEAIARLTGIAEKDVAKKQAALICEDMARFTPPLIAGGGQGLSKAAQKAGDGAVAGDIRKMFVAVGDRNVSSQKAIVFRTLAHATQTNNRSMFDKVVRRSSLESLRISPIMTKILNDPNYDRAFLKARNYLNRVPLKVNEYGLDYATDLRAHHNRIKAKFGGRMKRGQKLGEPRLLVESKQMLDEYIKERQVAVGKTKSAWLRALMGLPMPSGKNGPINFGKDLRKATYIARHAGAGGYSRVSENAKEHLITIGNHFGNVNSIADEANTMALALGNRDRQMKVDLEQYMERTIRRLKAGQRS